MRRVTWDLRSLFVVACLLTLLGALMFVNILRNAGPFG